MRRRALLLLSVLIAAAACSSTSAPPDSPSTNANPRGSPSTDAALPDSPSTTSTSDDGGGEASLDSGDGGVTPADAEADASTPVMSGTLGVLSLNLHCLKTEGTSFPTNDARFAAIAATVKAESIDVILAQEVCVSTTENAHTKLTTALENATGTTWSSALAFVHKAWAGTPDEADENVAIFVRGGAGALTDARENVHRAQASLRRVTLGGTFAAPITTAQGAQGKLPVRLYSVHLDYLDAQARARQAREVASAAMVESDDPKIAISAGGGVLLPVIIAGDFNAQSGTDAPKAMLDQGFVETSGSATSTRIDHVFVHRSAPLSPVYSKEVFTGGAAVSDHPGVVVRLSVGATNKAVRLTRFIANGSFALPLALRGDRAPLSWAWGWPAYARGGSSAVAIVSSEMPSVALSYKFMLNDTTWATGGNASGMGETDNLSSPTF